MKDTAFTIEMIDRQDVPEPTRGPNCQSKYEPICRRLLSIPEGKAIHVSASDTSVTQNLLVAAPNLHNVKSTSLYGSGFRIRTRKSGDDAYLWLERIEKPAASFNGEARQRIAL